MRRLILRGFILSVIAVVVVTAVALPCAASSAAGHWEVSVGSLGRYVPAWSNAWRDGLGLAVGRAYNLNTGVQLEARVCHGFHAYRSAAYPYPVPGIEGYRYEMSGSDSRSYEASLGLRFLGYTDPIRPVATIRVGIRVIDVGEIRATTWHEDSPGSRSTRVLPGTGEMFNDGFISLGFGVSFGARGKPKLVAESALIITSEQGHALVPFVATVQF